MSFLTLENIKFRFASKNKISFDIENFSLDVEEGSFTTLLGPSGCGKTTLLRMIAGFLEPDSGNILISGKIQNSLSPDKRQIAFVFQDYALFPHLNVAKNILYGLENQNPKPSKDTMLALLHQTARILALEGLLDRFPHELSGGQQQRVALGRALILKPKILLMDEPLSSLDAKLRILVREELKEIQKQLGITTIYVTHDREEAFSLSDKIAVINHGKLQQYGTPKEIYYSPENRFTADFAGRSNFFEENGKLFLVRPEWLEIASGTFHKNEVSTSGTVPDITETAGYLCGTVISSEFLGQITRVRIKCPEVQGGILIFDTLSMEEFVQNSKICLKITNKVSIK